MKGHGFSHPGNTWRLVVLAAKSQFESLDWKDVHRWPALPKGLLCCLLGGITAIAAWSFCVRDLETLLGQEQAVEVGLRTQLQIKLNKVAALALLNQQHEQLQQHVAQLEKQLPSKTEMASLLVLVNQAGIARNLRFGWFKPGHEVLKDYYAELPIAVSVSGQFHEIGMFAADIANLPHIAGLSQFSLRPIGNAGHVALEAMVKTYRYLDSEEMHAQQLAQKTK